MKIFTGILYCQVIKFNRITYDGHLGFFGVIFKSKMATLTDSVKVTSSIYIYKFNHLAIEKNCKTFLTLSAL